MNYLAAIQTRYVGPGRVRGSAIIAKANGIRIRYGYRDDLNRDQNHAEAVRQLCNRLHWSGSLVCGGLPDGSRVWVWRQEQLQTADELVIDELIRGYPGKEK